LYRVAVGLSVPFWIWTGNGVTMKNRSPAG
jgi:hypothetical protein